MTSPASPEPLEGEPAPSLEAPVESSSKSPSGKRPAAGYAAFLLSNLLIGVAALAMGFSLFLSLMGMRTMYVVSDSMVPTFARGDLLVVSTHYNSVTVGDIVGYHAPWAEGKIVTHRVVEVEEDNLTMKGDHNATVDPPVEASQLFGEIVAIVPKGGWLFNPYTLIALSVGGIALSLLSDFLTPKPRHAKLVRVGLKKKASKPSVE